jgi:hypothetical protein
VRDGVAQAVAHAVDSVFLIAAPIAALGLLLVLFLKEYPLRTWDRPGADPVDTAARSVEQVSASHREAEQARASHEQP